MSCCDQPPSWIALSAVWLLAIVLAALGPAPAWADIPFGSANFLNSNADDDAGDDIEVALATDGNGVWVAVWSSNEDDIGDEEIGSDYDILFSRSTNNGASWSEPLALTSSMIDDSRDDFRPSIAADSSNRWVVVWERVEFGSLPRVVASSSTNNGASWSSITTVSDTSDDDDANQAPSVATDGNGGWVAVWQRREPGRRYEVRSARSFNGGFSWSGEREIVTDSDDDDDEDKNPVIKTDRTGNWIAVWERQDQSFFAFNDADIFFARSFNAGASWTSENALNTNDDEDDGNDLTPDLAGDGRGNWIAVWQTFEDDIDNDEIGFDGDILVAVSNSNGAFWSHPFPISSRAFDDDSNDLDAAPRIATDRMGRWAVVWTTRNDDVTGGDDEAVFACSFDNGSSWSSLERLDPGAEFNGLPAIAADASGHWIAAWEDDDGSDFDIAYAAASINTGSGLINLSTRGQVGADDFVMIGGFIIEEGASKTVLLTGRGPSLSQFGVPDVLADPTLTLFNSQGTEIASNNDWGDASNASEINNSSHRPARDAEAAILTTLQPGSYTVHLAGAGETTGQGLVEIWDENFEQSARLINISTRGEVGTGDFVMIGGFIIGGSGGSRTVLITGLGPSLEALGVPDALQNPTLRLFRGSTQIAFNDNWMDASNASEIEASVHGPENDAEAAIRMTLAPGTYTVHLAGADETTGQGLVEIWDETSGSAIALQPMPSGFMAR
jgi:hypothetical protein